MTASAPPQSPLTRPGLLPDARHLILPEGIVSTGWPSVREVCRAVGIEFDPWQADANAAILAKDSAGLYAADVVGMSICRQAGKTYDVGGILFADCIINPGTLAVWTAHHFTVTREAFWALKAMAEMPQMWPHVDPATITTGAGNECIWFRNGSRIMFKARESGAVRGVAKVRRLVLDEAQILSERAMADLSPTMNQAANPQVIAMGTPPKPTDDAQFFTTMRRDALRGDAPGSLWIEFGADPGARWDDEAQRRKANPSYPLRTGPKAIDRLRKLLTGPGDFEREVFGIWDDVGLVPSVIPAGAWDPLAIPRPAAPEVGNLGLGVKFSADGSRYGVGVALCHDGGVHVEAFPPTPMAQGMTPLVEWLVQRWRAASLIVLDGKAGTGDLVNMLRGRGVPSSRVRVLTTDQAVAANATLLRHVNEGTLTHLGQPGLTLAVALGGRRQIGAATAGGWGFTPTTPGGDVTPVESVALAAYGATTTRRPTGQGRTSGGRRTSTGRRAVML